MSILSRTVADPTSGGGGPPDPAGQRMIPTSTDASVQIKDKVPASAEAVVVFAAEGAKDVAQSPALSIDERRAVERLFASGVSRGKAREAAVELVDIGAGKFRRVVVAGMGKAAKVTPEAVRQAAG